MRFRRKQQQPPALEPVDPEADLKPRRRRMVMLLLLSGGLVTLLVALWVSQIQGRAVVLGEEIPVRSEGFGHIAWAVNRGVNVKKGDQLVRLDDSMPRLRLKEIEAELTATRAQLELDKRRLEGDLARLRAREEDARIELAKESERVAVSKVDLELEDYIQQTTDSLFDLELVSERERRKVQRDRAATNVAVKSGRTIVYRRRAQLREVQAVIKNQFRMMAQREQLGEAKVAALETKLARYRRELEATIIQAPCDGVVANAYTPSGSLVNVGDTVLSIVDTSQLSVAVFVPEEELGNVNLGVHEKLRVRFNAHPLRAVSATVTEQYARLSSNPTLVAPGLDPYHSAHSAQEGLVLASKANVTQCPFELRPGMTGTVILGRRRASWPLEVALRAVTRTVGL